MVDGLEDGAWEDEDELMGTEDEEELAGPDELAEVEAMVVDAGLELAELEPPVVLLGLYL